MELLRLLPTDEIVSLPKPLPECKNIYPTASTENLKSNYLLFIYRRVNSTGITARNVNITGEAPLAIVTDTDIDGVSNDIPIIRVKNARRAIAYAYSAYNDIDYSRLKIIGVTGTNGKTSTSTMLYRILCECGYKCGYIGTGKIEICGTEINNQFYSMTTPDPELLYKSIKEMQEHGCSHIVMEISSHSIALSKIAPLRFACGIFTNLSQEHLDFHKNMWEYYQTKASFFLQCDKAVINTDDYYGEQLFDALCCDKSSVGVIYPSEVRAIDINQHELRGLSYFYKQKDLIFKVSLSLAGLYNVYNSLLALKCAIKMGIKPSHAKKAVNNIKEIDGRLSVIGDDITVVIDYAHTPFAMENVLKTLFLAKKARQKLHVVFGCGGERDRYKRSEMGLIAAKYSDMIYVTEDNSRSEPFENIAQDITAGIPHCASYKIIKNREKAINSAINSSFDGDIVAIIGKGHEKYKIDSEGIKPFDERKIVLNALAERKSHNAYKAPCTNECK